MCQLDDPLAVLLIGLVILALIAYAIIEYLEGTPSLLEIDIMHKLNPVLDHAFVSCNTNSSRNEVILSPLLCGLSFIYKKISKIIENSC